MECLTGSLNCNSAVIESHRSNATTRSFIRGNFRTRQTSKSRVWRDPEVGCVQEHFCSHTDADMFLSCIIDWIISRWAKYLNPQGQWSRFILAYPFFLSDYCSIYLVVHEYVHDVLVDLPSQAVLRPPGENDKLYSQQGHQDQGGSHRLHVHVGLRPVGVSQLGHQHSYNI